MRIVVEHRACLRLVIFPLRARRRGQATSVRRRRHGASIAPYLREEAERVTAAEVKRLGLPESGIEFEMRTFVGQTYTRMSVRSRTSRGRSTSSGSAGSASRWPPRRSTGLKRKSISRDVR